MEINKSLIILAIITTITATSSAWDECDTDQHQSRNCWYECQTDDLCQKVCSIHEAGDSKTILI